MSLLSKSQVVASGTCSDCSRQYRATIGLSEGENAAYVRCAGCGHINNADSFESPRVQR